MASGPLHWVLLLSALVLGGVLGAWWQAQRQKALRRNWPRAWNLTGRPVFSAHERALYRELRLALPQHVILSKVGLLRFCQSASDADARAWYERLQALNVSFAVCTPQGLVVSVVDVVPHNDRHGSRSQKMKEAALLACRVRYLRCLPGQWPQPGLMAAWVLGQSSGPAAAPALGHIEQADPLHDAGHELARKLKERRAERAVRWAESSFSQDSFFAPDSRYDDATGPEASLGPNAADAHGLGHGEGLPLRSARASG
jgi:hypothetical protein